MTATRPAVAVVYAMADGFAGGQAGNGAFGDMMWDTTKVVILLVVAACYFIILPGVK